MWFYLSSFATARTVQGAYERVGTCPVLNFASGRGCCVEKFAECSGDILPSEGVSWLTEEGFRDLLMSPGFVAWVHYMPYKVQGEITLKKCDLRHFWFSGLC